MLGKKEETDPMVELGLSGNSPLMRRSTTHVLPVLISPSSTIFTPRSHSRLLRLVSAAAGCCGKRTGLGSSAGVSAFFEHPPPMAVAEESQTKRRGERKRKKKHGTGSGHSQRTEHGKQEKKHVWALPWEREIKKRW